MGDVKIEILEPFSREPLYDKYSRVLKVGVRNSGDMKYTLKLRAMFYGYDPIKGKWVPLQTGWSEWSVMTAEPHSYTKFTTAISVPSFTDYSRLNTLVEAHIYDGDVLTDTLKPSKITENLNYTAPKSDTTTDKTSILPTARKYIINSIKNTPNYVQVNEDIYIGEVTDTVKKAVEPTIAAFLAVNVNFDNIEINPLKDPNGFCTEPLCIVRRWKDSSEIERMTINGDLYLAKVPASLIIFRRDGRVEHYGDVMSKKEMMETLAFHGLISDIVNERADENVPSEKEEEAEEEKPNTILLAGLAVVAFVLIVLALERW